MTAPPTPEAGNVRVAGLSLIATHWRVSDPQIVVAAAIVTVVDDVRDTITKRDE